MPSSERVSVGVIGAGFIANFSHLPNLYRNPEANLKAICDENLVQCRETAERFHIPKVYNKVEDMLENEELQLVDVCVPPSRHKDVIASSLQHNVNCLVEKPLTLKTSDADDVIALAKERQRQLYVIHNYSALPAMLKAKAMIAAGTIGEVTGAQVNHFMIFPPRHLSPDHWCHSLPGDYFSEVGPHLAMFIVEFLGKIDEAHAFATKASNHEGIKIDELRIVARSNNALGTIDCSMNCPSRILTADIWGTKGDIHVDADYQAVIYREALDSKMNTKTRGILALKDITTRMTSLAWTSANVLVGRYQPETTGHRYLIQKSLQAIKGEGSYPIDTNLAREAVHLLELAFHDLERNNLRSMPHTMK